MQGFGGDNVHIIRDLDAKNIVGQLSARGIRSVHCNNGTYSLPADKMVPGMLAAFQLVMSKCATFSDAIVIAANSDLSMRNSFKGKPNEAALNAQLEPQDVRIRKAVDNLGFMYPDITVVGVFYDEETPLELYSGLKENGLNLITLHKLGYGTSPDDKPIIGGHLFQSLFAFPLPNDERPVMHADTRDVEATDRQPDFVLKLTEQNGAFGGPYITKEGGLLYAVPPALKKYLAMASAGPADTPAPTKP